MKAHEIANKAASLISGDRADQHGDKLKNHENIATMWNAYLQIRKEPATSLNGFDVAVMMSLLKVARMQTGAFNIDDAIDAVGYLSIVGELNERKMTC